MTTEEQQDQTIDDCFTVLSEMIRAFHTTFNILEPIPLNRYDSNDKSEIISRVSADLAKEVQEKKEAFRSLNIGKMSKIMPLHLPKLIRIRTKWRDSFVYELSQSPNFSEEEKEESIQYVDNEGYINSPNYGGIDVAALLIESSTISDIIEKRLMRCSDLDQRRHYLRLHVDTPLNHAIRSFEKHFLSVFFQISFVFLRRPSTLSAFLKWYTSLFMMAMVLSEKSEKIKSNYDLIASETEGETSTARQVLMLHSLGVLDSNFGLSQNKLSELLGTLLNRSSQTVKEALIRNMRDSKTPGNFDFILTEFEKYNLPTEKILSDLSRLRERN